MTNTCGTLLYLRINNSVATTPPKSENQSFPLSAFMVQNKGFNHGEQILTQMLPFKILLKVSTQIEFLRLLMIKE